MLNRIFIGGISLILVLCVGLYFYADWQKAAFDASLPEPPPATEPAGQDEHVHSHDGHHHHWHEDEQSPQPKARGIQNASRPRRVITHRRPPEPFPTELAERLEAFRKPYIDAAESGRRLTEEMIKELEEGMLEIFMDGRSLEETVQLLERHRSYLPSILERLSSYRAFQYLMKIDRISPRGIEEGREYAKRALAERGDPDFELRLYLARTEQDKATSIAAYRAILEEEPNQAVALASLGYRLAYDKPVEAIQLLKRANQFDRTLGLQALGLAYQRLGQYDVALDYLKKQVAQEGSDINHFTWMHLGAIERGDPVWKPIALTDAAEHGEEKGGWQHPATDSHEPRVEFDDRDLGTNTKGETERNQHRRK